MAFTWTAALETGNATIDAQHKELIKAINTLLEACAKGQGRATLKETTDFLYQYTIKHFSDEEKLQLASNYPDYINHKRYHESFKKVVREINAQLNEQGPTIVLVGKVNSSIGDWLVNHIQKEDVKVAAHIRARR